QVLFVLGLHPEMNRPAIDFRDHGGGSHAHPHRCRGDVPHVEDGAQALMPGWKQMLDGGERRSFDHVDHHRGRQDADLAAAAARLVRAPDFTPCSMRCCWLTLRCTSACMRREEAEFGSPRWALFSRRLMSRLAWFCSRARRAFSAGESLPSRMARA